MGEIKGLWMRAGNDAQNGELRHLRARRFDPDSYARVVLAQTVTHASFRPKHLRARRFGPHIYARVVSTQTFTRPSFRPKHLRARRFDRVARGHRENENKKRK